MRILTGTDRLAYDVLVAKAATIEGLERIIKTQEDALVLWRQSALEERQRAENAMDALLACRGIPPISPMPPATMALDDPLEEDPEAVADMEALLKRNGILSRFGGER